MSLADTRAGVMLVAAALTVSCGGGDGLEEYVAELNAICEDYNAEHEQIGEPQSIADVVEKTPQIRAAFGRMVSRIRRLDAPPEVVGSHERLLELGDAQLETLAALVAAAKSGDLVEFQEHASRNAQLNADAEVVLRDLGADSCTGA
jgi:hypothetical protein